MGKIIIAQPLDKELAMNLPNRFVLTALTAGIIGVAHADVQQSLQVVAQSESAVWNAIAVDSAKPLRIGT